MLLPITISSEKNEERIIKTKALLNTGAGGKFIDQNFVLANGIRTQKLEKPITVYNVDGTKNKTGMIIKYVNVNLQFGNRTMTTWLMVTGLGKQKVILGFPWFEEMNPEINWKEGTLNWRMENRTPTTFTEVLDEEEYLNRTQNTSDENDEQSFNISTININDKFGSMQRLIWQ